MHDSLSLQLFLEGAEKEVIPAVETRLNDKYPDALSPELLSLLFWNVLIGFVVNIAAGVVTALLPFGSKKSFSQAEIDELRRIFREEAINLRPGLSADDLRKAAVSAKTP
jgi:hypothetical protein